MIITNNPTHKDYLPTIASISIEFLHAHKVV